MADYVSWWIKLFTRSPEELAAERLARQPAPPPRQPNAQQRPKQAAQRTQRPMVGLPYHSPEKRHE